MATPGNLKFAIVVTSLLALAACIALVVEITSKDYWKKNSTSNKGSTLKSTTGEIFPYDNIRLPRHVVPVVYDLYMNPRIEKHEFDGSVDILLKINYPKKYIVLHCKRLVIKHKTIYLQDVKKMKTLVPVKILEQKDNEQLYIEFREDLKLFSDYKLHIEFEGKLDKSLSGFYRSTYLDPLTNTNRTIGVTQFEATEARKAFPCFDEPAMKAVYNFQITRLSTYETWFNTPRSGTRKLANGLHEDTYATTVKMSTYLVAFIVADDLASIRGVTKNGVKTSIVAPRHMIESAHYALNITNSVLDYYVTLFGVPFPLPKLDLVAIPDFSAGAMENWGLITYRLTKILIDEKTSSALDRQSVAMVISHEIAHQWFGDIVTMKWWTDLWLNEGFASYVEYLGIDNIYGESWSMPAQFVTRDLQYAMNKDCYYSSHPILIDVNNPSEIGGLFDTITYYKGSSVIRMAKFMLGEENLRTSLANYMKRYQFDNTDTSQLWDEFNKVIPDIDVPTVMDTWTKQMGYPVLSISREADNLVVQQKRFIIYESGVDNGKYVSPYGYLWMIPFTVYQKSTPLAARTNITILQHRSTEIKVRDPAQWYKANTDFYGYYRVNYDVENWRALCRQLDEDHTVFSESDRAELIDDAFNLARAGQLDMSVAFNLTLYLKAEKSFVVWKTVISNLGYITARMDSETYKLYMTYMSDKLDDVIKYVGWTRQPRHINSLLQNTVLSYGVGVGHKATLKRASELFNKFTADPVEGRYFYSDLKDIVYEAAVSAGGHDAWMFLWNRYLTPSTSSDEKHRIILTLCTSDDSDTIVKYLDMAFNTDIVPVGNFMYILEKVSYTKIGGPISWTFMVNNYATILLRYGESLFAMTDMIVCTASHFSTRERYNEVKSFYETHKMGSGKRSLNEVLEKIEMNIAYEKNNGDNIRKWFTK